MRFGVGLGVVFLVCWGGVWGVGQAKPEYAAAVPMPVERVADSYAIYTQLLPSNVIEWSDAPRTQWLVEDVTSAEPVGSSCASDGMMNPHQAISVPADRAVEFAEVLADFDAHRHERYALDAAQMHAQLPVRLMNEEDRERYRRGMMGYMPPANDIMRAPATPDTFKGAQGMHRFTAVYFNKAHTLAMTEFGMYCGGLCGNWTWVVLERKPDGWHRLPWVHTFAVS